MHSLAGIGLIRLHNANAMIGELVVGARQFDLGHMARDAVVFRHRTGFGFDLPAAMAGLALCVIVSRLYAEFLVRVVAGHATDARVVGIVAFTAPKAVRLEANVVDTAVFLHQDFCPGAVTAAAEVGYVFSSEIAQIAKSGGHRGLAAAPDHGCKMRLSGFVTMTALNSRRHLVQRKLFPGNRIGGVASETAQRLALAHQSASGFIEVGRVSEMPTECRSKIVELPKPTHAALVKLAVFLEDEGLTQRRTGAHGPANGHRDRGRAVGYRVEALIALALDTIRVFAIGRCKEGVVDENAGLLHGFEGVRHISGGLCTPFNMTLGATRRVLIADLRPDQRGCNKQHQESR